MSPAEEEEYELQTGVMRPHSPAALARGERLSKFVAATQDKVWVASSQGIWTLVSKDWCKESARPGHAEGWVIDRAKRKCGDTREGRGRGRPRTANPLPIRG